MIPWDWNWHAVTQRMQCLYTKLKQLVFYTIYDVNLNKSTPRLQRNVGESQLVHEYVSSSHVKAYKYIYEYDRLMWIRKFILIAIIGKK